MIAHLEPITFVIRIFENDDFTLYEDPYCFAATLNVVDKETVRFLGVDKEINFKRWRAMDLALSEAGFKYFTFEHNGKTHLRKLRGVKND